MIPELKHGTPLIVKVYVAEKTFNIEPVIVKVLDPSGAELYIVISPVVDETENLWIEGSTGKSVDI